MIWYYILCISYHFISTEMIIISHDIIILMYKSKSKDVIWHHMISHFIHIMSYHIIWYHKTWYHMISMWMWPDISHSYRYHVIKNTNIYWSSSKKSVLQRRYGCKTHLQHYIRQHHVNVATFVNCKCIDPQLMFLVIMTSITDQWNSAQHVNAR